MSLRCNHQFVCTRQFFFLLYFFAETHIFGQNKMISLTSEVKLSIIH